MQYPDWFSPYAKPLFIKHLSSYAGKPDLRFLQVGAFTGDASVWLLDNVLTGPGCLLVDVDTWAGSDEAEHEAFDWADVERIYDERTREHRRANRLDKVKRESRWFFADQGSTGPFDFVYIDADHSPHSVLTDGIAAYRLLHDGGLLAFDDYPWVNPRTGVGPAIAVDAIEACFRGRLQLIQAGAQAWFRKTA